MQYTHINVHFSLRKDHFFRFPRYNYRRIILLTAFGVSFVTSYTRVTHDAVYNLRNACNLNSSTKVCALSERQMQFWEDVDDGLEHISRYHETSSTGLSMDRIKTFAKTARGEISIPQPSVVGHQPSEEYVHGLTAKPFWDARGDSDQFPWAEKLEDQSHIIIEELEAKLARDQAGNSLFAGDSSLQNQVMGSGWSAYRLQRLGVWNAENCKEFPRTYNLLQSLEIPLAVRGVCFAKQGPQSGVQPHSDGRNFILTSHLGLKIPEGCWFEVANEKKTWIEGKLTTVDTSFEHSTGNPSNEDRYVLIVDFWHPELNDAERSALELVYDLRNKFESGMIPVRTPRSILQQRENIKKSQGDGLAGLWKALTGG